MTGARAFRSSTAACFLNDFFISPLTGKSKKVPAPMTFGVCGAKSLLTMLIQADLLKHGLWRQPEDFFIEKHHTNVT
jgi:hypothetical protein